MCVCVYACVYIFNPIQKLNIAEHFFCGSETLMQQECLFVCVYVCVCVYVRACVYFVRYTRTTLLSKFDVGVRR